MDIRTISPEEKERYLQRLRDFFARIQEDLTIMAVDIESQDLMQQATAVWIAGNLMNWYHDFKTQLRHMDQHMQTLNELQTDIQNSLEDSKNDPTH